MVMQRSEFATCKYCGSEAIVKYGTYDKTQLYWCKICGRKFKGDDTLFHMKVKPEYISTALELYYTGSSINDICLHLKNAHGYYPSKSVVFQWIDKYTDIAYYHFKEYRPQVGDIWVCDETVLDLDKDRKVWFWDIIDAETRYLIASRASFTRGTNDAEALMETAKRITGKSPKKVITDKLRAYWDGIELVFGADTEHVMSSPFAKGDESTAMIERWHSILKERTKVMKAFKNIDTLIQFTNGFLVYYNYLRPHESLNGKTPAEAANIDYKVKSWADVCRISVPKVPYIPVATRIGVTKPRKKPVRKRIIRSSRQRGITRHEDTVYPAVIISRSRE